MMTIDNFLDNFRVQATRKLVHNNFQPYIINPDKVLQKGGLKPDAYRDLLYDGHLSSVVQSRKAGALSLQWGINRGSEDTAESLFVKKVFDELDITEITTELLDYFCFGFQPAEIIWTLKTNKIVVIDINSKPHDWFIFDDFNTLRLSTYNKYNGEICNMNKWLLPRRNASYNNPYGEALLSKCYWPVTIKRTIFEFWTRFAEKYGFPYLIGQVNNVNEESLTKVNEYLDSLRQDGTIAIGEDTTIQMLEAARSSSQDVFKELLLFCNSEISKAILSQTLTTEQGDTGSYAMSQTHLQVRQDVIDADKRVIEKEFNKLIKLIIDFNFGTGNYPRFELYSETDVDMNLAQRDATLTQAGIVKFTMDYLKRSYGFKDDEITMPAAAPMFAEADNDFISKSSNNINSILLKQLQPVLKLIESGADFAEIENKMAEILPNMNSSEFESVLANIIRISDAGGQLETFNKTWN